MIFIGGFHFENVHAGARVATLPIRNASEELIMRKTKENLAKPPDKEFPESVESQETANEEHYELIGGENATEGMGTGYDADSPDDSDEEKLEAGADGPLTGDVEDPPTQLNTGKARRRKKRGVTPPHGPSNHPAARSPKTI
jgi:hypothetical protein